jgi:hypothetical protein
MLGKRNPQTTIFDGDQVYLEHVGQRTFYAYLAEKRHELFRDEDFADLYSADRGRPSVAPSLLCTALVLQHYERCSDQEAADRAAYDQRWKVALGTGELERPFVKSTLQLFRAQLQCNEKARLPFEASIQAAKRVGKLKSDGKIRAALDTTAIWGRGAVKDTYNLIADGVLQVMREVARWRRQPLARWAASRELGRFLASSIKGETEIDWDDKEARRALLEGLVKDARRVLEMAGRARAQMAPGGPDEQRLLKATEVLSQVLLQDVERGEDGHPQIRQGSNAERICSVHDPEVRHGRKSASTRFDGHKLAVGADVESQVIVAVDILPGSAKDDEGSLELAQQAEANSGLELEAALGDCAYGTGPNRQRFAEAGIPLLAKVPRQPETGRFTKDDFDINLEQGTCRCPAGEVTSHLVSASSSMVGGGRMTLKAFQFSAKQCGPCPLRDRCFTRNQHGRLVRLNPYERLHREARRWQQSPGFATFREQRQVVEHRLARMVQLGIRQARYFGRGKTLFQALMVATVANLTLVAAHNLPDTVARGLLGAMLALYSGFVASVRPSHFLAGRLPLFASAWLPGTHGSLKMAVSRPGL